MPDDDLSKQKNILGLSFRDLKSNIEESAGDFIFIDEEIGGDTGWKKVVKWLRDSFSPDTDKKGLLSFFSGFFTYVFSRLRVIFVLMSVFADIFFSFFEKTKDSFVRKSFWGRGGFLFYAAQSALVVIVVIVVVASVYRNPAITSANEENLDYISVPENDLMAMNASLNTLTPQNRERVAAVEYIVKVGDTLSSIAKTYSIDVDPILWANNLSESSVINPGDTLLIPPSDGVLVTVKKGDTIASLAKKYDSEENDIIEANWYTLEDSTNLSVGDEIFIPGAEVKTTVIASTSTTYSYTKTGTTSSYNPYSSVTVSGVGKFLGWPVQGGVGTLSKTYGSVDYYVGYHRGIDIASRAYPNIIAPADGVVIFAGCNGKCTTPLGTTSPDPYGRDYGYAWTIQLAHSNGFTTVFAHLSNIYVNSGETVYKGQVIGRMGESGTAFGPHLHFEVRRTSAFGTDVNPLYYMSY